RRNHVQVAFGDGDEIRERAVVVQDPDHRPVRAVPGAPGDAGLARPAAAVDLADDSLTLVRAGQGDADEFVPEHAAKAVVPPDQLEVRFADARLEYTDQDLPLGRDGLRPVGLQGYSRLVQDQGTHRVV